MKNQNSGWVCPVCNIGVSPHESTCPNCTKEVTVAKGKELEDTLKEIEKYLPKTPFPYNPVPQWPNPLFPYRRWDISYTSPNSQLWFTTHT